MGQENFSHYVGQGENGARQNHARRGQSFFGPTPAQLPSLIIKYANLLKLLVLEY